MGGGEGEDSGELEGKKSGSRRGGGVVGWGGTGGGKKGDGGDARGDGGDKKGDGGGKKGDGGRDRITTDGEEDLDERGECATAGESSVWACCLEGPADGTSC